MKAIPLSQGIYCIMDDDSYEWLNFWKWSVCCGGSYRYARRCTINPTIQKRQFVYLHKVVAGISDNYRLVFRDKNPLNLQHANLLIKNLRKEPVKWWGSSGVSNFCGVKWDAYHGLWRSHYHDLTIGYHVAEMEAAETYNKKALEIEGDNAVLNDLGLEVINAP